MSILIRLGLTFVGIAGTVLFSIAAVACLLSGYFNWREGFPGGIIDLILGICEFIVIEPISVVCILLTLELYLNP